MNKFNYIYLIAVLPFYVFSFGRNLGQAISFFELTFGVLFMYYYFQKGSSGILNLISLYIISLPIINLTKGSFFTYNIHTLILFAIIAKVYLTVPQYFNRFKKSTILVILVIFSILYYIFSFLNMGNYFSNLRIFELMLMAIIFPISLYDKDRFKNMIIGLSLNSILIMQVVISLGADRLMIDKSEFEGLEIGGSNPIGFGLPLAFCILMIVVESKRVVFSKNIYRVILLFLLALSLILTTSRVSIFVVVIGIGVFYFVQNKFLSFLKLLLIPIVLVTTLTLVKDINKNFQFAYAFLIERSQENSSDINKISSGRLEQWDAVFSHLKKHTSDLIFGFGPGSQMDAHQYISNSTENKEQARMIGKRMAYHALPLQIIVELGIIGLIVFYVLISRLFIKTLVYYNLKKEIMPVIGIISFIVIGLTVSSFDPFSGMFLGMAFIPLIIKNKKYVGLIKQNNIISSPAFR